MLTDNEFNNLTQVVKSTGEQVIEKMLAKSNEYNISVNPTEVDFNKLCISRAPLFTADGLTDKNGKFILINLYGSTGKWGHNYHKLVMLHELAHLLSNTVSQAQPGHNREWLYWQHELYKEAFNEEVAKKLSAYNIARYAGNLRDSNIQGIKEFANRILGIEDINTQIDYNLPNVKNYCFNLLKEWEKDKKQEQKFTETDYMFVLGDLHHSSNTMQSLNNILRDEKLFDNIKHYLGIDDPDTRFQYDSENMFSDEYLVSNCLMDDLEHYSEQKQQCALENQPELKQEYKRKR